MTTWNLSTDPAHYNASGFYEYDHPRPVEGTTKKAILANISKALGEKVTLDENLLGGFRFRSTTNRRIFGYVSTWN